MKAIINSTAILPNEQGDFRAVEDVAILYGEKIERILPMTEFQQTAEVESVYDAGGGYVSPGFINIHIHGCVGYDAMDDDARALPAMQEFQATTGVTSFYPTTMTYDFPTIYRALDRVRQAMAGAAQGARIAGCHMEGPFINQQFKGAQAGKNITRADFAAIAPYQDIVKLITLAPEMLEGDYQFLDRCREAGIIVSCGHSAVDYDMAVDVITHHGAAHITHLFNGMPVMHHRQPGLVGAALDTIANCELIADNVHSHPAAQRIVYRAKQGKHIILITDSMRACGLADGESELGGQKVFVKGTHATLADGTIAGSVLRMNDAVAIFAENTGAPLSAVIGMVTRTPAEELGIYDRTGSLTVGKLADITILDQQLKVQATIVAGQMVYSCKQE